MKDEEDGRGIEHATKFYMNKNLKRERIKRRIYTTRDEARAEIFDYIEMFYNPKRRHGFNEKMSPADYEELHQKRLASV